MLSAVSHQELLPLVSVEAAVPAAERGEDVPLLPLLPLLCLLAWIFLVSHTLHTRYR